MKVCVKMGVIREGVPKIWVVCSFLVVWRESVKSTRKPSSQPTYKKNVWIESLIWSVREYTPFGKTPD